MRVPSYRLHKPTGQAIVVIKRKFYYLGKYGTEESKLKYEKIIGEYLLKGRAAPATPKPTDGQITVRQLLAMYLVHCETYYSRDGELTQEYDEHRYLAAKCDPLVGRIAVEEFTPAVLDALRTAWVDSGNSRKYNNQMSGRLVRAFKWGVAKELVPASTWLQLRAVEGLKRGRCGAPDKPQVRPVSDDLVDAALEHMPDDVADMIRLQKFTAMRPGEVWFLRPADVDRSGAIWQYRPQKHKTWHHGKQRVIYIGPRAQEILRPYLLRPADELCFRRPSGKKWERSSYRAAVHLACSRAGVSKFNPNQLRHSSGTQVRSKFGLDGAQVALGHSHASVTQIYAELNHAKAEEIAKKLG